MNELQTDNKGDSKHIENCLAVINNNCIGEYLYKTIRYHIKHFAYKDSKQLTEYV